MKKVSFKITIFSFLTILSLSAFNFANAIDTDSEIVSIDEQDLTNPEDSNVSEESTKNNASLEIQNVEELVTTTIHLLLRYQDQVILDKTVNLPTGSIYNYHNQNETEILTTSTDKITVLGLLSSIDELEDSFSLNDVEYYESNFGNGFYVKCIDIILNDSSTKTACDNWQYVVNGQYLDIGMDKKELIGNENVYIYFGDRYQIITNKNDYSTQESITATLYEFDYINGLYASSTSLSEQLDLYQTNEDYSNTVFASSTLDTNSQVVFSNLNTTGTYNIGLNSYGWYWPYTTINIIDEKENDINTGTPSGGSGSYSTPDNFVYNAFIYLNSKIENGNFFDSALYTDWAAIAYASYSNNAQQKESIANYLINNPLSDNSEITDYERRAMALMSLEKNPYNASSINYIQKIVNSFDGKQIGQNTLYNDDIFGIITLVNAGYNYEDEIIKQSTEFLLSKQNNITGNFGDVDMTAAAIQALTSLNTTNENVILAIESAKNYLKSKQENNASFNSNLFSTAWSLQAIDSLGDNETNWSKNGIKPSDYLKLAQQTDGGISTETDSTEQTRVWLTSYAIPAYLNKNWNEILKDFSKINISNENISNSNTATTTPQIPTTTIEIVLEEEMPTSTEEIVEVKETEQNIEILPVLYSLEENTLDTTKTNSEITETRGEKIIEEQDLSEENEDEEIFEDVDNSSEDISETTEQEKLPANKKIAISLGLGALLYGLFLVFKLFV